MSYCDLFQFIGQYYDSLTSAMDYQEIDNIIDVTQMPLAVSPPTQDFGQNLQINETQGVRKESGKRGRKPGRRSTEKVDMKAKLERSRQSARECRARKKLRYQYLEDLVSDREKAVLTLRKEMERYHKMAREIDAGNIPDRLQDIMEDLTSGLVLKQEV